MKKLLSLLAVLGLSFASFAVEGDPDFSAATTALTSIKTALVSWAGTAMPLLVAIGAAFMVFWLGKMIFRLVKGWTSAAK